MPAPYYAADAVASGLISSQGLTKYSLSRIEALNPMLNAFCALNPQAMSDAEESDRRIAAGAARSTLEGVPVAIKDNLLVKGLPATWGSAGFTDFVPTEDELPVARLRAAGAVIIGKTNTPEFAARGFTANPTYGVTRNPWNPDLTPGGSSGGSAAAVASGMVPLALGTDGGGSIRRPAAHTGIVGLKPSIGRIARGGGFLPINLDFEVIGLMGRTVADVELLAAVMAGQHRSDPRSRFLPEIVGGEQGERLRIGYVDRIGDSPVDPAIRNAIDRAAANLAQLGHTVAPMRFPFSIERFNSVWGAILDSGLAALARQHPERFAMAQPDYAGQARAGDRLTAGELFAILDEVAMLRAAVGQAFETIDMMLTPTTAAQPWPAAEPYPAIIDGQPAGPRAHAIFTGWVNVSGHPAISIPTELDASGLPIGMQLVGDLGSDAVLLSTGREYERVHAFRDRPSAAP